MEKVILDTEALLKNRKNMKALLLESNRSYYAFDFQVMVAISALAVCLKHQQAEMAIEQATTKWRRRSSIIGTRINEI